mmetsp:Transcript_6333/g.27899  ORF Transcript_6333/g.27899 Transcript_6333/m.27899 type:complete len:259 (-) Transcript_6333:1458-2234(-)
MGRVALVAETRAERRESRQAAASYARERAGGVHAGVPGFPHEQRRGLGQAHARPQPKAPAHAQTLRHVRPLPRGHVARGIHRPSPRQEEPQHGGDLSRDGQPLRRPHVHRHRHPPAQHVPENLPGVRGGAPAGQERRQVRRLRRRAPAMSRDGIRSRVRRRRQSGPDQTGRERLAPVRGVRRLDPRAVPDGGGVVVVTVVVRVRVRRVHHRRHRRASRGAPPRQGRGERQGIGRGEQARRGAQGPRAREAGPRAKGGG